MGKKTESQGEKYRIWVIAILLSGAYFSMYYFHVVLRTGTIVTHLFYVPIILASIWWKRKGLVVALLSSGFLIYSHVFLRPDVATHNDYFRAFMFIVAAFVVAELSRRITKEHEALQAANQQLVSSEQQLKAANQQLRAGEQQLKARNQQLRANEQQLVIEITERKKAEEELLEHQAQLKSLTLELPLAEERERRRIAVELHDRISQSLCISKLKLEALCESAPSAELGKALDELCSCVGQTIVDTRSLTFDLSSPILYELGFETAVAEWLTEQIEEKHGIATEFENDGQPKQLDDDISVLLFRNVRELLINIVKHARAKKVKVFIRKVDGQIQVSVEDDGVGFDPAEVAKTAARRAGFGLFSVRERLEQIGGHLEIESEPGRGSRITMMAPLKGRKNTERR